MIIILLIFQACSIKQPSISSSATIIFKTPTMKFYDKGFVNRYDDHIHLQILNIGAVVLDLKIYNNKICQSTFQCIEAKKFNLKYLSKEYNDDFLYNLFLKDNIKFRDRNNKIFIKVIKD
jgi:hypothetical protein